MLRQIIMSATLATAACSSHSPSPSGVELATDRALYERIPGVPAPPLLLTLHNGSNSDEFSIVSNSFTVDADFEGTS